MAWSCYYVNYEKIYGIDEEEKDVCIMYDLNIPPHGGIRREWTTVGMKNGASKILFVEYSMEDDDPDGVWEAYGMKAESEYSFTVNGEKADPDKLFVYTLYNDGSLGVGFDIDTQKAEAIFVFAEPQVLKAEDLMPVAKLPKSAFRIGDEENVIKNDILKGADVLCLALFKL